MSVEFASLLAAILVQTLTAVWWASRITTKVEYLERENEKVSARFAEIMALLMKISDDVSQLKAKRHGSKEE